MLKLILRTAGALSLALTGYLMLIRPRMLKWGALAEEVERQQPGDDLVPHPLMQTTHAISIEAPVQEVWPWIVQMGQGRGGLYSYEWIENLMKLDIHNANRILPEFQSLEVGDSIPLAPNGMGLTVRQIEPQRALVTGWQIDTRTGKAFDLFAELPDDYMLGSWAFILEAQPDGTTRLVTRLRAAFKPTAVNKLLYRMFWEPGIFIMEQKMLRGIKERAEGRIQPAPEGAAA